MPVNYPNIHSLSTLGVIYHFNSNYRFHPLRTDFSGEGGSGKTMIADMIQLILVGPGEYKSATEATDKRPLDGIILKPKNNQYGASYILLNIEWSPKKFIAIGAFIEKSSKHARMFIAQSGFDWDSTLEPLTKPLYYDKLLINGKILPIEDLQHKLQEIHIKPLPLKQYHQLLFKNEILPIDLSEKKNLESYAAIFRSFSRGSGFKKDSHSLKVFLFGEEQNRFIERYQTEVKSIKDDYHEHERFREEIGLIDKKQGLIKDVFTLEKTYEKLRTEYLTTKVLYWNKQHKAVQLERDSAKEKFEKSNLEKFYIDVKEIDLIIADVEKQAEKYFVSKEALTSIESKKNAIKKEKEEKHKLFKAAEEKLALLRVMDNFLKENANNINDVKQTYAKEVEYKQKKALLEYFISHLNDKNITSAFNSSEWLTDFTRTKNNYDQKTEEMKSKLDELKSLLDFADLQNPDSLASWALKYFNDPLTPEQESVLRHFQKFPRKRMDLKRYVSRPEELFQNLDIKDHSKEGFWLNLDGVYEFIQFVPKQFLDINVSERKKLEERLALLSKDVKTEKDTLEKEIEQHVHLKNVLFDFSALERAVDIYKNRKDFVRLVRNEYANLEQAQFDGLLALYADKSAIEKEYNTTKEEHEAIIRSEGTIDPNNFEQQFKDSKKYFSDRNIEEAKINSFIRREKERQKKFNNDLEDAKTKQPVTLIDTIEQNLFKNADTLPLVSQLKSAHYIEYVKLKTDFETKDNSVTGIKSKFDSALQEYQNELKKKFDLEIVYNLIVVNPEEGAINLKSKFEKSMADFHAKYNLVTEQLEEGQQLKNTFHTGQLAHKLLPTVFVRPVLENENQLNESLTNRLETLYESIRVISSRKIEILKRVFTEVDKTYREYLDKVNSIDSYFKKTKKGISGGNKASLSYTGSIDYPAKWMNVFKRILDNHINDVGLFEQLSQEIDINEMMKSAFVKEGGTKQVEIEDLLDPKSYFDLIFELKLESGEKNSGSNSQTYTANALLGLARLAIIGDNQQPGIRIMPIDEAQGLGSNYEMLKEIAMKEKYQILTMAIETAGIITEGEQYIYILSENKLLDEDNYVPAMGIFGDNIITPNINDFIDEETN